MVMFVSPKPVTNTLLPPLYFSDSKLFIRDQQLDGCRVCLIRIGSLAQPASPLGVLFGQDMTFVRMSALDLCCGIYCIGRKGESSALNNRFVCARVFDDGRISYSKSL